MSTHSLASNPVVTKSNLHRSRFFLLATSIVIGVAVLSCPLREDALTGSPRPSHLANRDRHHTVPTHPAEGGFWHTEGSRIVSNAGTTVRISGVNWSGFETTAMIPGGLTIQDYHDILHAIRANGYNTVRLPFSNQMVEAPIVPSNIRFATAAGNPINQDLAKLDSVQILDRIVEVAGQNGLKVILDNHRSEAGSSAEENGLWFTEQYPETAWVADWVSLAARYKGNPTVIGFDLRNEPHNANKGGACWSCGGANDWHLAAQRAGDAVLRSNASLLIFVEGTDAFGAEGDFWGGDLAGVRDAPVRLPVIGRLVYSPHVYGPTEYQQSWFNASTTPASLAALYHRHWGFISEAGIAPVWIGEFGTPNSNADVDSTEAGSEGQWFQTLVSYLRSHPTIGWSYWGINGEDRYGLFDSGYVAPANELKAKALASIRLPSATAFETTAIEGRRTMRPDVSSTAVAVTSRAGGAFLIDNMATLPFAGTERPASRSTSFDRTVTSTQVERQPVISRVHGVQGSIAEQVRLATAQALQALPGQSE